ncbi:hypothetical protein BS78_05G124300 [Paspalum vaginatum]|nr:hypothetical protein BS78_05G124300 [Paspalum vaginatum]
MVEQELEGIWSSLPGVLEEEKLLLSAPKEEGEQSRPSAVPKVTHAVKANEKGIQSPQSAIPVNVDTVKVNEPGTASAFEEASGVNLTGKPTATNPVPPAEVEKVTNAVKANEKGIQSPQSAIPENVDTVKVNEPGTASAFEEASGVNLTGKPTATNPVPPAEAEKWFEIKGRKAKRYVEVTMARPDEDTEKDFQEFLSKFVCPGDTKPYYHNQLAAIAQGFGSSVLHVPYTHIHHFSRNLAMTICANYKRLKDNLNTAAINYMKKFFSMKTDKKLALKLLGVPMRHQMFQEFLNPPVLRVMKVFGNKVAVIKPTPEVCSKL